MIGGVAKFVERAADKANDPVFGVTFNNLRKQTVENERDSSWEKQQQGTSHSIQKMKERKLKRKPCLMYNGEHVLCACIRFKGLSLND